MTDLTKSHYDLIIIGNTLTARYIAQKAIQLKYRVALVSPPLQEQFSGSEKIFTQVLSYFGNLRQKVQTNGKYIFKLNNSASLLSDFKQILTFGKEAVSSVNQNYSLGILGALGVDVIVEEGSFYQKQNSTQNLTLVTESRRLTASHYIIATGSSFMNKPVDQMVCNHNFNVSSLMTLADLYAGEKLTNLGSNVGIISDNPQGIELAYSLSQLGKKVIFMPLSSNILSQEDKEVSYYLQVKLEAQGITIIPFSKINQFQQEAEEIKVMLKHQEFLINNLVYIQRETRTSNLLNLKLDFLQSTVSGLKVDAKLKTSYPQIYACGSIIGGYDNLKISQYEADLILRNFCKPFFLQQKVNYHLLPYAPLSSPSVARVGLTEKQAHKSNLPFKVIQQVNPQGLNSSESLVSSLEFIKIILNENQQILGVYLVGEKATEMSELFALAMQQKLTLNQLFSSNNSFQTSEINK